MSRHLLALFVALTTSAAAAADRVGPPIGSDGQDRPAAPRPTRVRGARANLEACLEGTHRAACRYDRLTPAEVERVRSAEARQNLLLCLTGMYAEACRHELLSPAESRAVAQAEATAHPSGVAAAPPGSWRSPAGPTPPGALGAQPRALDSGSLPRASGVIDPYATDGSPLGPTGLLGGHATSTPLLPDPRDGTSLARPSPDPSDPRATPERDGAQVGPRWPSGATDPAASYGTPFRTGAGAGPYGTSGPVGLTPP